MSRSIIALGIVAIALIVAGGCDSTDDDSSIRNTDFVARASFSHTLDAAAKTSIRIDGVNGTITVRGVRESGVVLIEGERRVGSESLSDAADFLSRLTVDVTESGGEIIARTDQPDNADGRECVVDYEVTIPSDLPVDIHQANGVIVLEAIESSTNVYLANGTLASEIDLPPGGSIDLAVVNGILTLEIPASTSADVSASVTNGEMHVAGLDFTGQAITDRTLTGTLGSGDGSIRLNVVNGILNLVGEGG